MNNKIATVFGGTGFLGTQIVRELADLGVRVKVATRIPESAYFLKPCGAVGQIVPIVCDYSEDSIARAIKGSDYVVNCVGILYQRRKNKFMRVHADLPETIAKTCKTENIKRFIQISALGCDEGTSKYAKSKLAGEKAARKAFKDTIILRPSIIFGEGDNFFNMFAHMARFLPFLPLIGGGKTKFQPVYVGDVSDAVITCLKNNETKGKTYELGGPDVKTFKELFQIMFKYTERPRALLPLPFFIAKIQAFFMNLMPKPLLTPDQVQSLKTDNIVSANALCLEDLNINPTSMALILPTYLKSYKPGGRFGDQEYA